MKRISERWDTPIYNKIFKYRNEKKLLLNYPRGEPSFPINVRFINHTKY